MQPSSTDAPPLPDYEKVKGQIDSIVSRSNEGVAYFQLLGDYRSLFGRSLEEVSYTLGLSCCHELFVHITDTVTVYRLKGQYYIKGIAKSTAAQKSDFIQESELTNTERFSRESSIEKRSLRPQVLESRQLVDEYTLFVDRPRTADRSVHQSNGQRKQPFHALGYERRHVPQTMIPVAEMSEDQLSEWPTRKVVNKFSKSDSSYRSATRSVAPIVNTFFDHDEPQVPQKSTFSFSTSVPRKNDGFYSVVPQKVQEEDPPEPNVPSTKVRSTEEEAFEAMDAFVESDDDL